MRFAVQGEKTKTERRPLKTADKLVRMYPNNGLREPVRAYDKTFSALSVLKTMFFPKSNAKAA
jgi:hypothetical protein